MNKVQTVNVGDRFGRLTITQLRPCVAKCDCGKLVEGRAPSSIANVLRSCGCRKRIYDDVRTKRQAQRFSKIECLNPGLKAPHREYVVTCARCGQESRLVHSSLYNNAVGCAKCRWQRDIEAP